MIMDEPLTGLDRATVDAVLDLLRRFVDDGKSVCCALHEIDVARTAFSRTVALIDGVVAADGATTDVLDADGVERIFTCRAAG
jgi:ABC-type hemin transport system ATPase subunit